MQTKNSNLIHTFVIPFSSSDFISCKTKKFCRSCVSPYIITRVLGIGHPNILHSDAQRSERTTDTALAEAFTGLAGIQNVV